MLYNGQYNILMKTDRKKFGFRHQSKCLFYYTGSHIHEELFIFMKVSHFSFFKVNIQYLFYTIEINQSSSLLSTIWSLVRFRSLFETTLA